MLDKRDSIDQDGDNNLAIQNSEITVIISAYDKIAELGAAGDYDGLIKLMKQFQSHADIQHPYYPHYKYKTTHVGNKVLVEHEPISKEAAEKFPLSYRGKFQIVEEDISNLQDFYALLHESFMNQEDIKIDVLSLNASIANNDVPTPYLEENTKDANWRIKPPDLPESLKIKVLLADDSEEIPIIDYAELNMGHGDRRNRIVSVDNHRQKHSKLLYKITFRLDDIENKDNGKILAQNVNFDFSIKDEYFSHVDAQYQFLQFIKLSMEHPNHNLVFVNLETSLVFMSTSNTKPKLSKEIDIDQELNFFQLLIELEKFFNIKFDFPRKVSSEDYNSFLILLSIMMDKPFVQSFKEDNFQVNIKKNGEIVLENLQSSNKILKLDHPLENEEIQLFGTSIKVERIEYSYLSVKTDNIEKLKQKLEIMDDGEVVNIKIQPKNSDKKEVRFFI